jgi:hypothetical protein
MTLPAVDSLALYGGALNNYRAPVDPTTDRDAAAMNKALASIAMMSHTAPRAYAKISTAATTGTMVLLDHDAVWGDSPGVAPVLARTSQGIFTVTWPTTVVDELGVTHSVSLVASLGINVLSTDCILANVSLVATNVLTFALWNTSTSPSVRTDGSYAVEVWAR